MIDKKTILILSLLSIILFLIIKDIKDNSDYVPFDDSKLRDRIDSLQYIVDHQQNLLINFQARRDTVYIKETKIKQYYHEIYNFNGTASSHSLDSVIRSNW